MLLNYTMIPLYVICIVRQIHRIVKLFFFGASPCARQRFPPRLGGTANPVHLVLDIEPFVNVSDLIVDLKGDSGGAGIVNRLRRVLLAISTGDPRYLTT